MKNGELFCEQTLWSGRKAYTLGNASVRLVTLTGGGHIVEFRFRGKSGLPTLNPFWVPPWKTVEPYHYRPLRTSRYGATSEARLLSGIAGHSICVDYFGPPSEEEAAQGLSFHGEAPIAKWQKNRLRASSREVALELGVRLPIAGLRFRREITLRQGEPVVYLTETVFNDRKCDHFFHWTQHVTLGPPFLSQGESAISLPGTKGVTHPHGYDKGKCALASNRFFRWPRAPRPTGAHLDLTRPFLHRGLGFVVAVLLEARRDIGFVAAVNTSENLLIGYCFRCCDYPWVAVWEENRAISTPPWNGRTQARGLEFGTTPLPVLRREAFGMGTLFETPTFACVPARAQKEVRYVAFLSQLPPDFGNIRDLALRGTEILVFGNTKKSFVRVPASRLSAHLPAVLAVR